MLTATQMMSAQPRKVLSDEQVERFMRDGFVYLPQAFSSSAAHEVVTELIRLLNVERGIDLHNPPEPRAYVPRKSGPPFDKLNTPTVLGALDDLLLPTVYNPAHLDSHGYSFFSFPGFQGMPWRPPLRAGRKGTMGDVGEWHIDVGYEVVDHLDLSSGNCALVPTFLLTTVEHGGGATVILPGSHKLIAKLLFAAGGRISRSRMTAFCEHLTTESSNIVEALGSAGDLYLLHPLLVHSQSGNSRDTLRVMCNTGIGLTNRRRITGDHGPLSLCDSITWQAIAEMGEARVSPKKVNMLLDLNQRVWKPRYDGKVRGTASRLLGVLGGSIVQYIRRCLGESPAP